MDDQKEIVLTQENHKALITIGKIRECLANYSAAWSIRNIILGIDKHDIFGESFFDRLLKNSTDLKNISSALNLFDKFSSLNKANLELVNNNKHDGSFHLLIDLFFETKTLNQSILDKLPTVNFCWLSNTLNFLHVSGILLSADLVCDVIDYGKKKHEPAKIIDLLKTFKDSEFRISKLNLNRIFKTKKSFVTLEKIVGLMVKCGIANNKNLKSLLTLSLLDFKQANRLLNDLFRNNLLNATSFDASLKTLEIRLDPVEETLAHKLSRKIAHSNRSKISLDTKNGTLNLFLQHKNKTKEEVDKKLNVYHGGSFGKVKMAYDQDMKGKIIYALKNFYDKNKAEAKREVNCHRLLNRSAFWFSINAKIYMASEWVNGKNLGHCNPKKFLKVPKETRLKWLSSIFNQLNVFHKKHRMHGDIKPSNCILDLKKNTLNLIDFGATHKRNFHPLREIKFTYTEDYLSQSITDDDVYDFCDDIYSMGILAAYIYPELYTIDINKRAEVTAIPQKNQAILDHAIKTLVSHLLHTDPALRCTAQNGVDYLQNLLSEDLTLLSHQKLKKIAKDTLDAPLTINDVMHGRQLVNRI